MAGVLRYKFKSEISYSSLLFDGMFISVGDLKQQVADKRGMQVRFLAPHSKHTRTHTRSLTNTLTHLHTHDL